MLDLANPRHSHIAERLRSDPIIWLGSVRPDGRPHLVPVWFLWDGEAVWIFSRPRNQKIINLRHNPHVILALDDSRQGSDPIVIEGQATLPAASSLQLLPNMGAYVTKYSERMKQLGFSAEAMAADYAQPIRVTPTRLIDL